MRITEGIHLHSTRDEICARPGGLVWKRTFASKLWSMSRHIDNTEKPSELRNLNVGLFMPISKFAVIPMKYSTAYNGDVSKAGSRRRACLILIISIFIYLFATAVPAQERPFSSTTAGHSLTDWRTVEGTWNTSGGRLNGEVSEMKRGFSVADDARFSY